MCLRKLIEDFKDLKRRTGSNTIAIGKTAQIHSISREGVRSLLLNRGILRERKKEIDTEMVRRLYAQEKWRMEEIAKLLHVSQNRISIALMNLHVPLDPHGRRAA